VANDSDFVRAPCVVLVVLVVVVVVLTVVLVVLSASVVPVLVPSVCAA